MAKPPDNADSRRMLSGQADLADAVTQLTRQAQRSLAVFTRDLAPALYDRLEFLDAVRALVLTRRHARVRVIVIDPGPAVRRGHRLIETTRSLTSFIEIRRSHNDYTQRADDFMVADEQGFLYRTDAGRYEAIADERGGRVASKYLQLFDEMWEKSIVEPEFRRLRL